MAEWRIKSKMCWKCHDYVTLPRIFIPLSISEMHNARLLFSFFDHLQHIALNFRQFTFYSIFECVFSISFSFHFISFQRCGRTCWMQLHNMYSKRQSYDGTYVHNCSLFWFSIEQNTNLWWWMMQFRKCITIKRNII